MDRTIVIVQARYASTRLPGKVLLNLNGRTVLSRVLERCQAIEGADTICCAVSDTTDSDPVATEAERCGVSVFRGPESDVLARYYVAAREMEAAVILRVTSDCPLLDPDVCSDVLRLRERTRAGYAANNFESTWPHGLDCEAFTFSWLERAYREAQDPFAREHVCPFIRNHPEIRTANFASPNPDLRRHRWTLDTPRDWDFMRAIFARLPEGSENWGWAAPLALVEAAPEIRALNAEEVTPGHYSAASS
jgi:spore coat polysaccharide biosynthesis protein SpsF